MSSFFMVFPLVDATGAEIASIVGGRAPREQSNGERSGGHHLDGDAVDRGVARELVEKCIGASRLLLTPACSRATAMRVPGRSWPQPWGRRHHARHHLVAHLDRHLDAAGLRRHAGASRRRRGRRRAASSGWTSSVQRSLPFTSTFTLCIHEFFERRWRRLTSTQAVVGGLGDARRAGAAGRRRCTRARGRCGPSGVHTISSARGTIGPRSMPCGCALIFSSVSPSGTSP